MLAFHDLHLETIQGCNRKCFFCPNKDIESTGALMSRELFDNLIGQLVEMDFSGHVRPYLMNEPFLDPRMPEMMRYIRKMVPKALCVVNTNGQLLTTEMARELAGIGVKLRISAYEPDTLSRFLRAKIGGMWITDYTHTGEKLPASFMNRAGNIDIGGPPPGAGGCAFPCNEMYVRHTGQVVLCCNDWRSAVVMGDANTTPLLKIFNNRKYANYRKWLGAGERRPPLCSECNQEEERSHL